MIHPHVTSLYSRYIHPVQVHPLDWNCHALKEMTISDNFSWQPDFMIQINAWVITSNSSIPGDAIGFFCICAQRYKLYYKNQFKRMYIVCLLSVRSEVILMHSSFNFLGRQRKEICFLESQPTHFSHTWNVEIIKL